MSVGGWLAGCRSDPDHKINFCRPLLSQEKTLGRVSVAGPSLQAHGTGGGPFDLRRGRPDIPVRVLVRRQKFATRGGF